MDDDVISEEKTSEDYIVVNVETANSSSSRDFPKWSLCDSEVGNGSGGVNANCSRPEAADDVISGEDAETFQE